MLLYIILLAVLLNQLYVREGLFLGVTLKNTHGTPNEIINLPVDLQVGTCKNRNTLECKMDLTKNVCTNDNDVLYESYQNILAYASGYC